MERPGSSPCPPPVASQTRPKSGREYRHDRRNALLDGRGATGPLEPVEPVGAQQNEMDEQRQHKQEGSKSDQRSARIEQEPNFPHSSILPQPTNGSMPYAATTVSLMREA